MTEYNVVVVSLAVSGNTVHAAPSPSPTAGATTTAGATPSGTGPATGTPTGGPTASTSGTATPTSPATSGPGAGGAGTVFYGAELFIALAIVAAALAGAALLWSRNKRTAYGGLITGIDNRRSTGKAIAVAWTVVVAWMVVTEALIAAFAHHSPDTFSGLLGSASDLYFVFLGGPFAAAAFAKATIQSKIAQGSLTKTTGTAPSFADLVSDDNGNADLYDFQYVLFNIIALLIVSFSFWAHAGAGLPAIPAFLAILTGGSALTYTVNKAIATGGPQITSVDSPNARIGDIITITGVQLLATTAGAALPTVTIGGISASGVAIAPGTTDALIATVVDAPAGTTPLTGTKDVVVTPPLASPISAPDVITIVPDKPEITAVGPSQPIKAGDLITATGSLLLAPGTKPGTASPGTSSIGGVTPSLTTRSGQDWPITVEGPYDRDKVTLRVGTQPSGLGAAGTTDNATLKLTRGALVTPESVAYQVT